MKIRSKQNWKLEKRDQETPKGKSLTVPDDSYSIKEILEKYTQGIDPMLSKVGTYIEDTDLDDHDLEKFQTLDRTEQSEIIEETGEIIERAKKAPKRDKKKDDEGQNPVVN